MNYPSQLKGWAVDRVIEAVKAKIIPASDLQGLMEAADDLAEYCYVPDKDLQDAVAHISKLVKEVENPLAAVQQLMLELSAAEEDIQRQIAMKNSSNGKQQDTVQ